MTNNSLQTTEKNLRSIAKRYENVKYSVGLAVLFLMKGTSAFSEDNKIQEIEKQKDILTDAKKEKAEVKETKKKEKATQKLKASWANVQFGANDLYSNFFVTPKNKVEKTSIVKNEKTVLVASADNSTSLPMLAKITSDIEETSTPTTEEINTSKENLRNSVGNLQNKIDTARKENQKEIDLNYDFFSYDAVTLDNLESRSVSLKSRKHDKGLKLHFEEFPNLIIWSTLNKGPFIALEPWSGLSTSIEEGDRLEDKKDVKILKPGRFEQIGFDIEIL